MSAKSGLCVQGVCTVEWCIGEYEEELCILLAYIHELLPYQVKTQYLQILIIAYTSIIHSIYGRSTTVVKGCMYICLIWKILPLVTEKH